MVDEQLQRETAILLGIARTLHGSELPAAMNARLRQAVKRAEAAADALEGLSTGARTRHHRRVT